MSMQTFLRSPEKHVQDWVTLVSGVLLCISPWALGFADVTAPARTAWVSAFVVGVFAISALVQFKEWEEWVAMVLGLWLIAAPWIVGFTATSAALTAFVVLGIVVALASLSEIWGTHHPTTIAS